MIFLLAFLLLLCSCAPMPGNTLIAGVPREALPGEVEVVVTVDMFETQKYCTENALWYQVALNCLTNACFIPGCALVYQDPETKLINKCYVYVWMDSEYLLKHELRHCQGFADFLF